MKKLLSTMAVTLAALPLMGLAVLATAAPANAEGDWCWSDYDGWYYCADQPQYPPAEPAQPIPCYYDENGGCYLWTG